MPKVLVPLAQGCEELEAVTVIDLLRRAEIEVLTASLGDKHVRCSRQTMIVADYTLDEVLELAFDMIVLPGGLPGSDHLNADPRIKKLLLDMAGQGKYTAAICAAPKVLANAGLLNGKKATAYPGVLEKIESLSYTQAKEAVVQDGKVVTSRGPGTAMDFSLHLIELLVGRSKREMVEAALQRK